MEIDALQPNDGYYKYNLHHLTSFNLLRTVDRHRAAVLIAQAVGVMDKTTRDDLNAHFEAITYAAHRARPRGAMRRSPTCSSGSTTAPPPAARAQQRPVRQRHRLRPRGRVRASCIPPAPELVPREPGTVTQRGRRGRCRSRSRPPTDFLWQRPPTNSRRRPGPDLARQPGIDFLTPYWMLRYFTEVSPPPLRPLPKWAGPAHV